MSISLSTVQRSRTRRIQSPRSRVDLRLILFFFFLPPAFLSCGRVPNDSRVRLAIANVSRQRAHLFPITVIKDSCARKLSLPASRRWLLGTLPYMQYSTHQTDSGLVPRALDNDLQSSGCEIEST